MALALCGERSFALYLNVFVGVVQAFGKVSFLNVLAPKQTDPAFIVAQGLMLVLFVYLGIKALRTFHPAVTPDGMRGMTAA